MGRHIRIELEALLQQYGIDMSTVVIGTGNTYTQGKHRFEFDARNRKEIHSGTAKYAIKYFTQQNVYLLWEVYHQTSPHRVVRRGRFSADADDVLCCVGKNNALQKGVEFPWKEQELVRVFNIEGLKNYIAAYLCKH